MTALRSLTAVTSPSPIISVAIRASDRPSSRRASASSIWVTSILRRGYRLTPSGRRVDGGVQVRARADDQRLRRRHRRAQSLRGLDVRAAVELAQHEGHPLALG